MRAYYFFKFYQYYIDFVAISKFIVRDLTFVELKKLMKPFYTRLVEQARAAASPKVEENAHAQEQSFSSPDSSNAPHMDMD